MSTTSGRSGAGAPWTRTSMLALALVAVVGMEGLEGQESTRTVGIEALARQAMDQNRELMAAREGLQVAEEQVSEAWSNVYPSIDFSASYTRNISPAVNFLPAIFFDPNAGPDDYIPIQFGADNQWNASVYFEQPLFEAGVFVGVGAAGRYRSFQNEVVRGQAQTVVTRVRTGYYELLLAQEQLRLVQNSVARVRESLKETRALNAAGLSSDYDVLRLEVELANLEPNLGRAQNATLQARRRLAIEVDWEDQEALYVSGTLAEMNLDDLEANSPDNQEILAFMGFQNAGVESVEEALDQAAISRSDIRQFTLNEELREAEMKVEQMAYLPEITLFGNYIVSAQNNGSPSFFASSVGQRAYSRIVGLSVTVPIFQGFRRDARIDQRRASLRQAQAQTQQGVDFAAAQVRSLVEAADEALQRARGQRLAVTQASRGFEIASAQYREGLGSQLELTDAEEALRQSEFNYAQAVYDYLLARARLDESIGQVPLVDVDVWAEGT